MAHEKRHLKSVEQHTEMGRKWQNQSSNISIKAAVDSCLSEIDLLQLHLNIFLRKNWVLEYLHYFFSCPLEVICHFSLRDWLNTLGAGQPSALILEPSEELLVLLVRFKGEENIGLLAQKAIDHWLFGFGTFSVIHLVQAIILMIIINRKQKLHIFRVYLPFSSQSSISHYIYHHWDSEKR